jgi:hypothetical protein
MVNSLKALLRLAFVTALVTLSRANAQAPDMQVSAIKGCLCLMQAINTLGSKATAGTASAAEQHLLATRIKEYDRDCRRRVFDAALMAKLQATTCPPH